MILYKARIEYEVFKIEEYNISLKNLFERQW